MIADEEEPEPIDFAWFYFIGRTKLGLTFKEVGRMTLTMFNRLYKCYQDNFDLEMMLRAKGVTYKRAYEETQKAKEWF